MTVQTTIINIMISDQKWCTLQAVLKQVGNYSTSSSTSNFKKLTFIGIIF